MYTNIFLQKCTNIPVKNKEIGSTGPTRTVHKSILYRYAHVYVVPGMYVCV